MLQRCTFLPKLSLTLTQSAEVLGSDNDVDVFTLGQISNDKAGDGSLPRQQLDGKRPTRGIACDRARS